MTITPDHFICRVEGLLTAPADRDLIILSLQSDHYVGLDAIGRRIWELLEQPQTAGALCQRLCAEFDGPAECIEADLLQFLEKLESEGVIHASGLG